MNTLELEHYLKSNPLTRKLFHNVLPCDFLTQKIKSDRSVVIICNCATSNNIGTHWIAIFIDKFNLEFFDTSGQSFKTNKYFQKFAQRNKRSKMIYNTVSIQSEISDLCGEYCLLFALHKAHKKSLKSFMNIFRYADKKNNDKLALFLFGKNFLLKDL